MDSFVLCPLSALPFDLIMFVIRMLLNDTFYAVIGLNPQKAYCSVFSSELSHALLSELSCLSAFLLACVPYKPHISSLAMASTHPFRYPITVIMSSTQKFTEYFISNLLSALCVLSHVHASYQPISVCIHINFRFTSLT